MRCHTLKINPVGKSLTFRTSPLSRPIGTAAFGSTSQPATALKWAWKLGKIPFTIIPTSRHRAERRAFWKVHGRVGPRDPCSGVATVRALESPTPHRNGTRGPRSDGDRVLLASLLPSNIVPIGGTYDGVFRHVILAVSACTDRCQPCSRQRGIPVRDITKPTFTAGVPNIG